ncbi:MAG: ribosomal L7Ae/L30e/S12e/Gadd45 family protein [Oscillospiraceae bacterium]|nr:ribosomal L7Ae/L30e/S12e/Gadd45 family protein [Oscillospiraceae bacterium]
MFTGEESLLSFLGLAKKAGKLHLGFKITKHYINCKSAKLVLLASDLSQNSFKKLIKNENKVCTLKIKLTKETIGNFFSEASGILVVIDESFTFKILNIIKEAKLNF